ncbi:stress response translation initiation inhibitor YciH [Candidatus Woesearchaeota archaeon]|nr:stress response translation initiation inhibitor YciH [Candidatus Woesearchaeota archaeon]
MTICQTCGLPQELCVCESIAKETQKITISIIRKKYGKKYTLIEGFEEIDLNSLCKRLKAKFACGGAVKKDSIELQGDHKQRVKEFLIAEGFAPETIVVK